MDGNMNRSEDELPEAKEQNSVEAVLAYHRRTKHHLHHYAASPGYLDWATQPDPFRTYVDTERVELPLLADRLDVGYAELYCAGAVPAMPLERDSVGMLFELALGLSAWKQYQGNRWALRCNPSSGNLHPTEGYAILPQMPGLNAGVYHYVSRDHCLERRCVLEGRAAQELAGFRPLTMEMRSATSTLVRIASRSSKISEQRSNGNCQGTSFFASDMLGPWPTAWKRR